MGQKVHPTGFRLGFNKTWRSRWYADKDYAKLLHEDIKLRDDPEDALHARRRLEDRDRARRQQAEDRHLHLAPRHHHRPQGDGSRQAEAGDPEEDQPRGLHQHPGDPEAGARRAADRRVGGDAAREARRVPPRDAQGGRVGAALRRARHQGARVGAPERRRDRALRVVPARPAAAADAARRHRLRLRAGVHDLRLHRRQGVALQGRAPGAADRPRRRLPGAAPPRRPRSAITELRNCAIGIGNHWELAMESIELRLPEFGIDRDLIYVDAEEGQVPQAAARPDGGQGLARVGRVVRRLRPEGARALLDDGAADRGGARRDDPVHQARRQDLGARVPGQADHQEAAGNPHGQGQGRARGVGVRRAARAGSCSRWKA